MYLILALRLELEIAYQTQGINCRHYLSVICGPPNTRGQLISASIDIGGAA